MHKIAHKAFTLIESTLTQALFLLGTAVIIIVAFQRLRIPSSLAYLLVGVLLGPHTAGPIIEGGPLRTLAEFGIVFLLFTIGLNFSLPQLHAMRHQVLGLGTAQVVFTTVVVGLLAWLIGVPPIAAFVVGAVFAQSSSTIIGKQLEEQSEEHSRHGRLGLAMSVFQDVTAVPFVIVIPVLASTVSVNDLAATLGWALAKAVFAALLLFFLGRWLLRPLFHLVASRHSTELFTLTVLFVSLTAAWTTQSLGLSMAFGAFLAGMMLGETEFRHQIEATIRPFRDVLLGLFFVGIGMLINPLELLHIWHWALAGAFALLLIKIIIVAQLVPLAGIDRQTAWRTAVILAVGGEFGFALLAIALNAGVVDKYIGQILLTSVLFSMIAAPFLIRHNQSLIVFFTNITSGPPIEELHQPNPQVTGILRDHAIICGYGRIGQSVGHFLEREKISFVALDLDSVRVKEAHAAGEPVFYGDSSERAMLEAVGVNTAKLVVISHQDLAAALKALHHIRSLRPDVPIMVRTSNESDVDVLLAAGATEVVPETMEASLMIASQALLLLNIPFKLVMLRMQEQRATQYRLLRELYKGDELNHSADVDADRLKPVSVLPDAQVVGKALKDLNLDNVIIAAIVQDGERCLNPPPDLRLQAGDVIVLFGMPNDLLQAENYLSTASISNE